ncbi:MAG: 1-deoxy-D-xylulose-5-phosphate synthase [Fibrobacteres bacterium]|nr:1-deoxy-D-xylulose-5-phosphate synthase [Fibrobacterota bacterium]
MLEKINSPKDFRSFNNVELRTLAEEVRERILSVVSETGGHLASSLGTVELTLALHYAYNTPSDKIVWDVGHQCYAHKILTGRNGEFPTIRQYGGLSGFPRTSESEYDVFDVGHASTSISVALGFVEANAILGKGDRVVAVIGDGSMTGGLAFEGLNNAGASHKDITVILNDNKMSISPNVGAMSSYLTKVISDPRYNKLKNDIWEFTGKMKNLGQSIRTVAARLEEGIKGALLPGRVFEDLGFRYFGPIDGHNLEEMITLFNNIQKNVKGPVLIHVVTKKGKGYTHAEENAPKFHGVGVFEKETGQCFAKTDAVSWSAVFGQTVTNLAAKDDKIVAITAAMPTGTGLDQFAAKYPTRYFDVGIAEGHAVTFSAGLAKAGLKPVLALYSTFLQRAYDNVIHDLALQNIKVIIGIDRGGLTPDDGPTHHGLFDMAFLRCVPNLTLLSPKDGDELQDMVYTAMNFIDGPVCIRYPRGNVPCGVQKNDYKKLPLVPETVLEGSRVLFIAYGEMVNSAVETAKILKDSGINPTVLNLRVLKPLNTSALLPILKAHSSVYTFETGAVTGGLSSSIMELMRDNSVSETKMVHAFGFSDSFVPHGDKESLLKECGLIPEKIAEKVKLTL